MSEQDGEYPEEDSDARSYFRVIEEVFIRLRGTPFLLSSADWQLASRWREEGIPLDLVCRALEQVFERRRLRQAEGRVQSLRYCRHAVEAAWNEVQELNAAVGSRQAPAGIDVDARLRSLARHLPLGVPQRELWVERLLEVSRDSETAERQLEELDGELLTAAEAALDTTVQAELRHEVEAALARLADRVSEEDGGLVGQRLHRQALRRRLRLPVLSLFSPEAEEG